MKSPQPSRIGEVTDAFKDLAAKEAELARTELAPIAKHAAIGSGVFGGAAALALHALWMMLIAFALFVGWLFSTFTALGTWPSFIWGFVTVALASLLVAGILALVGKTQFARIRKPEVTIAELQATAQALSEAFGKKESANPALSPGEEHRSGQIDG